MKMGERLCSVVMARLKIYKDNYVDSTVVSNRFIDEYMKDANDAQLKVYLYLIRMLNANQAISVSDIADKFNHTEKDVMRSLKYWEKQKLLTLDYDDDRNLSGIHLCDLSTDHSPAASEQAIQTVQTLAPIRSLPASTAEPETEIAPSPYEKPVYSLDQLKEFKSRESTSQLLYVAEMYIGKPLTPSEIKSILFYSDVLGFSSDLIDYLNQYCVDRGKKDFKYIDKVAVSWAEEGVTTPKQAQRHANKYDKCVYTIMNELGKTGSPTAKEMEYINRWTKEYGFTTDIILEACERTVLATDKHRFEYAEGILSSWKNQNVHHKSDIQRMDDLYQKRKSAPRQAGTTNRFNSFTQNNYDFEALEKQLLSN